MTINNTPLGNWEGQRQMRWNKEKSSLPKPNCSHARTLGNRMWLSPHTAASGSSCHRLCACLAGFTDPLA